MTLQDHYEKNPLTALKIDDFPPSIITKLRIEPADYMGTFDYTKREEYIKQNAEKIAKCLENIKNHEE